MIRVSKITGAVQYDRLRPHLADRVGQVFEPVADHDAHIGDATVLQLGEHPRPILRSSPPSPAHSPSTSVPPSAVVAKAT